MDEKLLAAIIAGVVSVIVALIGVVSGRKLNKAQSQSQEGNAAQALSEAAENLIQPYVEEVKRLRQETIECREEYDRKLSEIRSAHVIEIDEMKKNHDAQMKVLTDGQAELRSKIDHYDKALSYLVSKTFETHPAETKKAIDISRGLAQP